MSVYHSMRHSQSGGGGGLAEAGKADAVLEDVIVVGLTAGGQGVVVATAAAAPVHPAADRSPGHVSNSRVIFDVNCGALSENLSCQFAS